MYFNLIPYNENNINSYTQNMLFVPRFRIFIKFKLILDIRVCVYFMKYLKQ